MKHAVFAILAGALLGLPAIGQGTAADEVMKADEQFRVAKLHRDTGALAAVLAENFYEINQNGNTRDKAQTIELWKTFEISSLTTDSAEVKVTGGTAVVRGAQTEHNSAGVDHMLYMRVYVREAAGWKLLAAMQYRDPRA